jgi:hypothetical protein
MMDVGLKAWADIVKRVYPDLPILRDKSKWLAGQFDRPSVFIETDLVSDNTHTPQSNRIIEDVGLVFHYDIERIGDEEKGEPRTDPLRLIPFLSLPSSAAVLCGLIALWGDARYRDSAHTAHE